MHNMCCSNMLDLKLCNSCANPSQQVNVIAMSTFDDLTSEDVDEDPLIVLRCGHAFVTSTMDGILELASAYDQHMVGSQAPTAGSSTSVWSAPRMLSGELQRAKGCPTCRQVQKRWL